MNENASCKRMAAVVVKVVRSGYSLRSWFRGNWTTTAEYVLGEGKKRCKDIMSVGLLGRRTERGHEYLFLEQMVKCLGFDGATKYFDL